MIPPASYWDECRSNVSVCRGSCSAIFVGDLWKVEKCDVKKQWKTERSDSCERGSGQSLFPSGLGSTVGENNAFRSFFSLPTITKSFGGNALADVFVQAFSSRQADEALGFSRTQVTDVTGSDSMKTLGQILSDFRKKRSGKIHEWSKEGRPTSFLPSGLDERSYVLNEEMLELAHLKR